MWLIHKCMLTSKGQDWWKDIWIYLQEPEAILTISHILAYKVLTLPGHQETEALTLV